MPSLDIAMAEHMAYIVMIEKRPFTYRDFLVFEVGERTYTMKHGTFRNKLRALIKTGEVSRIGVSGLGFYTLEGHEFQKPVTPDHALVHNHPLYKLIEHLPWGQRSIHDIRLRFKVPEIWNVFSASPEFKLVKKSQDIAIPTWSKDNALIRTIIHKTDYVSVIVGCSLHPIALDIQGIINFFSLLARVEEQLQAIVNSQFLVHNEKVKIPDYKQWIVTMWHFGRDTLTEYNGERFCATLETIQGIIFRIYSKEMKKGKMRPRLEKQEYPMKTILDAIEEKLS